MFPISSTECGDKNAARGFEAQSCSLAAQCDKKKIANKLYIATDRQALTTRRD